MRYSRWIFVIVLLSLSSVAYAQEVTATPTSISTQMATTTIEPTATVEPTMTTLPEATTEPTAEPTELDAIPPATGNTYTVRAGDTLYRIAVANGTTVALLSELNNITNPAQIYVGQVLILSAELTAVPTTVPTLVAPTAESTVNATVEVTEDPSVEQDVDDGDTELVGSYVVQPGETLYRIAINNNTTLDVLQSLNNMTNVNSIYAGQRLILPTDVVVDDTATESATVADVPFGYGIQVYKPVSSMSPVASQLVQLGVNWVKLDVSWAEIELQQGEYDFVALDETVAALDGLGINILMNVYDAPSWSRSDYTMNELLKLNSGPPANMANFGVFMSRLATQYNGVVDAYEIWKSPNLLKYWTVPVYATEPVIGENGDYGFPDEMQLGAMYYMPMLEAGYDAVKQVDPNALVITAGLAPVGASDNYNFIATGTYLNNMLLLGAADYSDGIGAIFGASAVPPTAVCCTQPPGVDSHYESFLQYFLEVVAFYNDMLVQNDVDALPVYVTQFGWGTTEGTNLVPAPTGFEWLEYTDQAEQALYITQAFELGRELEYVGGMFLYNLDGCAVGDSEACFFSLIDANGTARPAFGALQNFEK